MDACLEADQVGTALEQEVLPEPVATVHLEREAAQVAQLLLSEPQKRPALAPQLARRRCVAPRPRRRRSNRFVGNGLSSPQSMQERDAHHVPESTARPGTPL